MTLDWTFLATLIVMVLFAISTRVPPMLRTAITLAAAYVVNTAFVLATKIYDPWYFFLATDAIAARTILYHPAGKIQGNIGGLLLAQIMVHGIYGLSVVLSPDTVSTDKYLQILDLLGYIQLLLLGGWSGGRWISYLSRHRRGHRPPVRLAFAKSQSG